MPTIYALLVGINGYAFKPLQGCINDVDAVEEYLKKSYGERAEGGGHVAGEVQLVVKRLTDADAQKPTRQNLIDGFHFFDAAKKGDTCLFYYSGHGSFSPAPADLENNGELNVQSFVCLDSRGVGGMDLMDKEMAYLLWQQTQAQPEANFVVITDCCHSGTITKALADKSNIMDRMASPGMGHVPASVKDYLGYDGSTLYSAKQSRHIHLAAAKDNQTSKELLIEGQTRGAFTWALLKTLNDSGGQITYRKLLNKTATLIKSLVGDQNPMLNFNGGLPASENNTLFLSQERIVGDKGVFPGQSNQPIAISFAENFPEEPMQLLKKGYVPAGFPSIRLEEGAGQYILRCTNGTDVFVTLPGSEWPVFVPATVTTAEEASTFLGQCEKLCYWVRLQELDNPSGRLEGKYSFKLFRTIINAQGEVGTLEEVASIADLYPRWSNNQWDQAAFKLQLFNTGDTDLYITTAYLGFDYRIIPDYFSDIQLSPGKSTWLKFIVDGNQMDVVPMQIDDEYKALGYREIIEYLKVFISTEKIDTAGYEQSGLKIPAARKKGVTDKGPGMRNANAVPPAWATETIGFRIIEPAVETDLAPGKGISLGSVTIAAHPTLKAKVSLSSSSLTARSADGVAPPYAANGNSLLEPFDLQSGTRSSSATDVVELFGVEDAGVVSAESPLIISVEGATDMVWPIGYDAETKLYYPLGRTDEDGNIRIETLPAETASDAAITQRSFLGSIKIYFQKVIGEKLGFTVETQRLAIPWVVDEKVKYDSDVPTLSTAVAKASKILVFVHGIIGDTEGMAKCVRTVVNTEGATLSSRYDLVLTFDYENLNTSIEETGVILKEKLAAVGLKAGHGKELVIAAHSMGGLVSRWMIEKEGGDKFVSRLVMLGTPNNGTPWADVRDLLDVILTYAINGAAFLKPYLFIVKLAGKAAKGAQVTIKEMDEKTGIYKKLNTKTDPGIPYSIVVGNTRSIIVRYAETANFLQKFFVTVKKKGVYATLDAVLFHKPNDIAVTDVSISDIPGAKDWKAQPVIMEVACDHLNYFVTASALERIL